MSSLLDPESVQLIVSKLELVASQLGVAVERVYPLVKHSIFTEAWLGMAVVGVFNIVSGVCAYFGWKGGWKRHNRYMDKYKESDIGFEGNEVYGWFVAGGFLSSLSMLPFFLNLHTLLNLDFETIKEIANMITK